MELLKDATDSKIELHISAINLAEVQYLAIRRSKDPTQMLAALEALPLEVASADAYIPAVVELKANHSLSLADCFAAALAQDLGCPLLTNDPEFKELEEIVTIEWLA